MSVTVPVNARVPAVWANRDGANVAIKQTIAAPRRSLHQLQKGFLNISHLFRSLEAAAYPLGLVPPKYAGLALLTSSPLSRLRRDITSGFDEIQRPVRFSVGIAKARAENPEYWSSLRRSEDGSAVCESSGAIRLIAFGRPAHAGAPDPRGDRPGRASRPGRRGAEAGSHFPWNPLTAWLRTGPVRAGAGLPILGTQSQAASVILGAAA